jgi:protein TonB
VRSTTIVVSVIVHAGLAAGLYAAANQRVESRRRAIAVQVAEEKKKPPAPKPEPKAPPKPVPRKVASLPKEAPAPAAMKVAAAPKAAPIAMPIQMSNEPAPAEDNSPGGIVIPVARPAAAKPAAARTLASVGGDGRKKLKAEPGGDPAAEGPCGEEPSKPEPVFKTEIEYTAQARAEGIEGKLKLKLVVGRDGSVIQVDVLAGVSPELDAAAVEAAKKWRFRPAMACGRPVDGGTYILARKFELGD